ncbi:sigma-70 family RNA polymerase sigma factor [Myroides odoratimimus]|uniref:sigma-70 family RNA polymerase sigma factor n=1 Tax=Myroides odoratimimus TaxID=76832 RepID=UPI0025768DD8|nr:sigma-70 family RNA polymerase sigma factor [Myroides odoratimimus]MDM1401541.1 sigma-70 family RNA polymerase sigma factor [Myroides odoratimimus]
MALSRDQWVDINYYKYWDILYYLSCNITRDKDLSADIVQDVFVNIWNNYSNLIIDNSKAYLIQSVRNKSLKAISTTNFNTVQLKEVYNVLVDNEILSKEEEIMFKEQLVNMIYSKAQEVLPEKCYQIFVLRYSNKLSYKEIALKLGISESTVDNQINKALKSIKSSLPYSIDYIIVIGYLMGVTQN